ncbi:MAG: hypothetical protein M1832_003346 [Thelocarpon impressellum]|nr:MAG: hypothetical protein M1832_003346 [Thelocarpon impressellum]
MHFSTATATVLAALALTGQASAASAPTSLTTHLTRRCNIKQRGNNFTVSWVTPEDKEFVTNSTIRNPQDKPFWITSLDFGVYVQWPKAKAGEEQKKFATFIYSRYAPEGTQNCRIEGEEKQCNLACETSPFINGTVVWNSTLPAVNGKVVEDPAELEPGNNMIEKGLVGASAASPTPTPLAAGAPVRRRAARRERME